MDLAELGWHHTGEITINLAGSHHIGTDILFDLYPHGVDDIEAIIDTGSAVCFINRNLLLEHAPTLLTQLLPCPVKFSGIVGGYHPY